MTVTAKVDLYLFTESDIRQLLIDVFPEVGRAFSGRPGEPDINMRVIELDGLLDGIEERIEYLAEEREWNEKHGLTAICPEDGVAMDPEKTWCSHRCYHAYRQMLSDSGITDLLSDEAVRLINKENR